MKRRLPSTGCYSSVFGLLIFATISLAGLPPFQATAAGHAETEKTSTLLTRQEVQTYLAVQAKLSDDPSISIEELDARAGSSPRRTYTPEEVKDYLADATLAKSKPTNADLENKSGYVGPKAFPWLRLRRSFSDVLTAEDPSLEGGGAGSFDDLEGALFSYSRDLRQHSETWSSQAALLAPFSFYTGYNPRKNQELKLARWGFIPSFSVNRISTTGDPATEVDQLIYRVGGFMKFRSGYDPLLALTLRAYASFLNDHLQDEFVSAGQFEIEPTSFFSPKLQIGARAILVRKHVTGDVHDTAWVAYQLRTILHGEWGALNGNGPLFKGKEYDFFRLGPVIQLDLKPLVFRDLSISLKYQYLPALSGRNPNDSLFTADAEWAIHTNEEKLQKLSLKISYVNGGIDLTKERARTLLIGLGAAF
jgi:hypothetical protein